MNGIARVVRDLPSPHCAWIGHSEEDFSMFEPSCRQAYRRLVVVLGLLPTMADAHGGPCSSVPRLTEVAYFFATIISLLTVLVAPFFAARFCPGKRRWRILLGLMLAALGWASVVVIGFFNILAGMGCGEDWQLAALNIVPALLLGIPVGWLWARRRRNIRDSD